MKHLRFFLLLLLTTVVIGTATLTAYAVTGQQEGPTVNVTVVGCTINITITDPFVEMDYGMDISVGGVTVYSDSGFGVSEEDLFFSYTFTPPVSTARVVVTEGFGEESLVIYDQIIAVDCNAETTTPGCGFPLVGAVVGSVTKTVNAYWSPSATSETNIVIPAGKTFWILGRSEKGDFLKIVIACKTVWIPTEAMGPNFDAVWWGAALPNNVVK
jgi:hypothetical protein